MCILESCIPNCWPLTQWKNDEGKKIQDIPVVVRVTVVAVLVYGLLGKDCYRVKRNVSGHAWPCFVFHNSPVISLALLFRQEKLPSVFKKITSVATKCSAVAAF